MKQEAFVKNAADPKQVKEGKKKERFLRSDQLADVKFLLETKQGRRFLDRLLGLCGIYESSYTGNSETFFREGKRIVGLTILRDITEASPEGYLAMLKEKAFEESNA